MTPALRTAALGQTALIVISDGVEIYATGAEENAKKLKTLMGDKLCIYPIQVGENKDGKKLMDGLAKIGGCGFAVNAADISVAERHGRLREEGLPGPRGAEGGRCAGSGRRARFGRRRGAGQPRQVPGHAQGREGQRRRLLGSRAGCTSTATSP